MSLNELEDFSNFLRQTSQLDQNVKSNIPNDEFDEDEPVMENAWETSGKFEGDLVLNERQRRMILTNVAEGLARNGLTDSTKRWPNNEVVYFIQPDHFNSAQTEAIQTGIADLARVSCVKFRPYEKGDKDAVVIQGSRRGCFSQVGYQGGYQVLNLSRRHPAGRGCFRHGTVVHELLHTLGFYHMQSSPDRDDYIDVLWENIIKPARHNFRKYNSLAVSDFGVGYDYESVLHYSRRAFSSNGQDTLIPKKIGAKIGQRIGLSGKDVQKLNKMYCDADTDLLIEDSSDTPDESAKPKAAKNKPFEGHGLGYQQGKIVIIRLPRPETTQMPDLPQFPVFDYFSKTTQELPPALVQGVGIGKKMNHYNYVSPDSSNEEEYVKSNTEEQFDNKDVRALKPYDDTNEEEDVSSDTQDENLTEDLIRILSDIEKIQENQIRLPEEYDNSDPRMRLLKESEEKKFNSFLVSPLINDNIKNVNSYIVNGPPSLDLNHKLDKEKQYNQREPDEQDSFQNQPLEIRLTDKNLPDSRIWYRKDTKPKHANVGSSHFYPQIDHEQVNYSYFDKVPKFEKWFNSDQPKHESYRDRNPTTQKYYR
ncbi:jg2870 [Pararge aegeria aegeria]|uniref:Metalloendopeptidase n=2 Tax=Pararge aegeria TaxID=116150 RepID=A0A8S4SGD4_9NEOP|nr:jg2870 [Pararge aegeria aegeria]